MAAKGMSGIIYDNEMPIELKVKVYKTVVGPVDWENGDDDATVGARC